VHDPLLRKGRNSLQGCCPCFARASLLSQGSSGALRLRRFPGTMLQQPPSEREGDHASGGRSLRNFWICADFVITRSPRRDRRPRLSVWTGVLDGPFGPASSTQPSGCVLPCNASPFQYDRKLPQAIFYLFYYLLSIIFYLKKCRGGVLHGTFFCARPFAVQMVATAYKAVVRASHGHPCCRKDPREPSAFGGFPGLSHPLQGFGFSANSQANLAPMGASHPF